MSDIVERLRAEQSVCQDMRYTAQNELQDAAADEIERLRAEVARLRDVTDWVDVWVSNPVGAYSVNALDGMFASTRDRLAALTPRGP